MAETINFPELENLAGTIQRKITALKQLPENQLFNALLDTYNFTNSLCGLIFKDALQVKK
jgi:hypothetical protein